MTRKVTTIWRFVLAVLIIVLNVGLIIGLTSCNSVDSNEQQETFTGEHESELEKESQLEDESKAQLDSEGESQLEDESKTQLESEGESQSESTEEIIQTKKAEGIITEFYEEESDDYHCHYFKLEGNDNLYKIVWKNYNQQYVTWFMQVGQKVYLEYVESEGICNVQTISF